MSKALLLHGTDGSPDYNWFPWLKAELTTRGYEVWAPRLPGNHTPNKETYDAFLRASGWDFTDNLIIGHSSGATTALNLLCAEWFPNVQNVVLVGLFLNEKLMPSTSWYEAGQFDNLFPEDGFNLAQIKRKAARISLLHGDDDPYCSYDDAEVFAKDIDAEFITVSKGRHLSSNREQLSEILPLL